MGIGHDRSVGDKFACLIADGKAIAASETDKETCEPVWMSVADEKQALGLQFVEEVGEADGQGLLMKFPHEFERLLIDQRAVRDPRYPAEKMKDDTMGREEIVARDIDGSGVRRVKRKHDRPASPARSQAVDRPWC